MIDPIGVLHHHTLVAYRPVLGIDLTSGVITLVKADVLPVVTTREEVRTYQRVIVGTLVGHVTVVLQDVAGAEIQRHAVVQEGGGVTHREIVTIVTVIRHNTA